MAAPAPVLTFTPAPADSPEAARRRMMALAEEIGRQLARADHAAETKADAPDEQG